MFLGSRNPLLIFLQSYHVWVTSKIQVDFRFNTYSEVLVIVSCRVLKFLHYLCFWGQGILCWHFYWATMFGGPRKFRSPSCSRGFRSYPNIRSSAKCSKFISNRAKRCVMVTRPMLYCQLYCHVTSCHVMSRHVTSCHVMLHHFTSCHVMPRHATSCHVMTRHVTSSHVLPLMSCHATSCHVMSRYVTPCHVMSRPAMSRPAMSCHVMSRHVTSCHVMPRCVTSCHVTSCHVVSRHVTLVVTTGADSIPHQRYISSFLSFFFFFFYSTFVLRNYSTDSHQIFRDCVFWCSLDNPVVLKFFQRHLAEKNAKNSKNLLKISRVDSDFWQ